MSESGGRHMLDENDSQTILYKPERFICLKVLKYVRGFPRWELQ